MSWFEGFCSCLCSVYDIGIAHLHSFFLYRFAAGSVFFDVLSLRMALVSRLGSWLMRDRWVVRNCGVMGVFLVVAS